MLADVYLDGLVVTNPTWLVCARAAGDDRRAVNSGQGRQSEIFVGNIFGYSTEMDKSVSREIADQNIINDTLQSGTKQG